MPSHVPLNNVRILIHCVLSWNIYTFWVCDLAQIYKEARGHHSVNEIILVRIYVDVIPWKQDCLACACHMSPSPIVYNHISPMHGRSRTWFITLINYFWRNLPLQFIKSHKVKLWHHLRDICTCCIYINLHIYSRQFGYVFRLFGSFLQSMCDVMLHPMFIFVSQFHIFITYDKGASTMFIV